MIMLEKHVACYSSKITQIKTKDEANFTIVMMVSKPRAHMIEFQRSKDSNDIVLKANKGKRTKERKQINKIIKISLLQCSSKFGRCYSGAYVLAISVFQFHFVDSI